MYVKRLITFQQGWVKTNHHANKHNRCGNVSCYLGLSIQILDLVGFIEAPVG